MKSAKSLLVISDMHNGSTTALCSPHPTIEEQSTEFKPNYLQRQLYEGWVECLDSLEVRKPDLCVVNGEPIDGANKKQLGNQSWSTNLYDQVKDSVRLLKMIKPKKYILTRGSGYHVQLDGTPIENVVAKMLKAESYSIVKNMQPKNADFYANVNINGKAFSFSHHVGYNKSASARPGALAREMMLLALDKGRNMKYDVVIRSHVHYYSEVRTAHMIGVTTPCWKYPDGHLFRGGLGGTFPDIGMTEIITESNGYVNIIPHLIEDLKIKPGVYRL